MNVAVVGCTGYTGYELTKLVKKHPLANLTLLCTRDPSEILKDQRFNFLTDINRNKTKICELDKANFSNCDLVFFSTPHGVCMRYAETLLDLGIKVVDLSADFRLKCPDSFEKWYGIKHRAKDLLDSAIYGLPELYRDNISKGDLIAMPGCYPTAIMLGVLPLINHTCFASLIIADCKSGISGAGRSLSRNNLFGEVSENFKAYGLSGHRHHPEIIQEIKGIVSKNKNDKLTSELDLIFTPHVVPMFKGLYASIYVKLKDKISQSELIKLYRTTYGGEQFIKILPEHVAPETRFVCNTNEVHISVNDSLNKDFVNILVAEDNLLKGAAGQAVQVMNVLFGFEENAGLE